MTAYLESEKCDGWMTQCSVKMGNRFRCYCGQNVGEPSLTSGD